MEWRMARWMLYVGCITIAPMVGGAIPEHGRIEAPAEKGPRSFHYGGDHEYQNHTLSPGFFVLGVRRNGSG